MKAITFDLAALQRLELLIAEATEQDPRLSEIIAVAPGPVSQAPAASVMSGRGQVVAAAGTTRASGGRRWCLCVDSTVGDNSAAGRIAAVVLSGFGRGLGWDVVMDWQGSLDQADFEGIPGGRAASVPGLAPLLEGSEPPVCIELLVIGGGKLKDVAGARCVVILEAAAAAELLEAAAVAEGWAQRQVSGAGQPARATVRDALFQDLQGRSGVPAAVAAGGGNMGLLLDVPLQLTVELGRARRTIKEVLAFGPGAVVELDRLAGEPVDVLINGKLLGKGEVVVINENFGIRVTDILSPAERVKQLG